MGRTFLVIVVALLGGVAALALPTRPPARAWVEGDHISTSRRVMFKRGYSYFTADSSEVIRAVARAFARLPPDRRLLVEGHTDATGDESDNVALSQARANEVRRALVRLGVAEGRIDAVGRGSSRPLVDDARGDHYRNRRIEFVIVTDPLPPRPPAPVIAALDEPAIAAAPAADALPRLELLEDNPASRPLLQIAPLDDAPAGEDGLLRFAVSPAGRPGIAVLDDVPMIGLLDDEVHLELLE